MKKYLLIVTITLSGLVTVNSAFSQSEESGSCPQKDLLKRFTELQDSLARFFAHVKKTTSSGDYETFEAAIATDSIDAFDVFAGRSSALKDSINALLDSLKLYTELLRTAIDPQLEMSNAQFIDTVESRMACVLADQTIITTNYLFEQGIGTGGSMYRLADDGPCEDGLRAALTSARASYNYAVFTCTAGVGCPGWWRIACVGACLVYNSTVYNQNKADAFCDYFACMNKPCSIF